MKLWKYPEMHITSLPLPRNKFIWPSYLFQTHFFFFFQNKSVVLNTSQESLSVCLLYLQVLCVSLLISVCVSVSEYLKAYGLQATETIAGWLKPINDLLGEPWDSSQNQKTYLENLTLRRKPLQYCKVISLQIIKVNEKKKGFTDYNLIMPSFYK